MDISKVLMEYDNLYGTASMDVIEDFLVRYIEDAYHERDYYSELALVCEMLNMLRDTMQEAKADEYILRAYDIIDRLDIEGSLDYATTLINIANVHRAFGRYELSIELFGNAEEIYIRQLEPYSYEFVSLYTNWSNAYKELENYAKASEILTKNLEIVDQYPKSHMEQATIRTNIASMLIKICQNENDRTSADKAYSKALKYLEQAITIFEREGGKDPNYSSALAVMGDALYLKRKYEEASTYYSRAMIEIEKKTGMEDAYKALKNSFMKARRMCAEEEYDEIDEAMLIAEQKAAEEQKKSSFAKRKFKNNIERCRAFYDEFASQMIHEKFPDHEKRIAVGLVGEGSDCMAFDDDISMDHDYGIGLCMWLTELDYDDIGSELQVEYKKLLSMYGSMFFDNSNAAQVFDERRGVFSIGNFFDDLLEYKGFYDKLCELSGYGRYSLSEQMWMRLSEEKLSIVTSGIIFRDDLGDFSRIREAFAEFYPRKVVLLKLAQHIHTFSQTGQYNYSRMMARKDYTTALICKAHAIKSALHIVYLLNKRFAPYYKWLRKGAEGVECLGGVLETIDEIAGLPVQSDAWVFNTYNPYLLNTQDKVINGFENIASAILRELNDRKIINGKETFLDVYVNEIIGHAYETSFNEARMYNVSREAENPFSVLNQKHKTDETKVKTQLESTMPTMKLDISNDNADKMLDESFSLKNVLDREQKDPTDELIEEIVLREWNQFDKVDNEDGNIDCEDDWETFSINRKSQYMTWPLDLLSSYRNDLAEADNNGWNLVMEKYARMMESTAPDCYRDIKDKLPRRSLERIAIQEEIIKIQIEWMEEFAIKHPKMALNSRSIHSYEDSHFNTSYETYLRGEISTYSENTLVMYGRFIAQTKQDGSNLAEMIMTNTAHLYGFETIEEAESKIDK